MYLQKTSHNLSKPKAKAQGNGFHVFSIRKLRGNLGVAFIRFFLRWWIVIKARPMGLALSRYSLYITTLYMSKFFFYTCPSLIASRKNGGTIPQPNLYFFFCIMEKSLVGIFWLLSDEWDSDNMKKGSKMKLPLTLTSSS